MHIPETDMATLFFEPNQKKDIWLAMNLRDREVMGVGRTQGINGRLGSAGQTCPVCQCSEYILYHSTM